MKPFRHSLLFVSSSVISILAPIPASAADVYWDFNGGNTWAAASNWNTAADGSGSDTTPTASDTANFNITGLNTNVTTSFGSAATASVGGLVFNNTGTTAINVGTKDVALSLGPGGISVNSGAGAVTFGNTGTLTKVSFNLLAAQTWTNNSSNVLTLNSANTITTNGNALNIGGTGNVSMGGAVSGAGSLIKTGANTLIVAANSATYTGAVTISGGTLQVGAGLGAGSLGTASGITNNATLAINRTGSLAMASNISGTGNLTVEGGVNVTLSGNNSYQGTTTLKLGQITVTSGTAFGTGTVTVDHSASSATTTRLNLQNVTLNNDFVLDSNAATSATGLIYSNAGNTLSTINGDVTVKKFVGSGGHIASPTGVIRLNGELNADGVSSITHRSGTVEYAGGASSNYMLTVTGTARLGANNGIGSGVRVNLGASGVATLDMNGYNTTLQGITQGASAATVTNGGASDSTLTLSSATDYTFAGVVQDGGTNKVNLVKDGNSTLTLSGNNTYTGTTLVSTGTLLITGALGNTVVTVSDGATIGGTGSIGTSLALGADAKLQLGSTLTVPSATLATGFDMTNISGLSSSTPDDTYTLINGNVSLAGVNNVGWENAYVLGPNKWAYFQQGSLQVVVIPEPAAAWLGALGMTLLLRRRR